MDDIEHHRQTDFQLADLGLQAEGFVVTRAEDGSRIEVAGICPGCGGKVTYTWTYGIPGHKGIFTRKADRPEIVPGPRTVVCDCGYIHPNCPPESEERGCGAYWQVMLS